VSHNAGGHGTQMTTVAAREQDVAFSMGRPPVLPGMLMPPTLFSSALPYSWVAMAPSFELSEGIGRLLSSGREAVVYDQGDGTVLKLFRDPSSRPACAAEARILLELERVGIRAPRLDREVEVDGRPGLVMSRVDGTDWLTNLGKYPAALLNVGRRLAHAHVSVHAVSAPRAMLTMHERLRTRISGSVQLNESTRAAALGALDRLAPGEALCHGDFHLENLLGPWRDPVVIDWGNTVAGPPVADVARTLIILGFGETSDHAPAIVRVLAPVARRMVIKGYVAAYGRERPGSLAELRGWRFVQAVARIGETTPKESTAILAALPALTEQSARYGSPS
jgi:aminoglycoside phosphotransferase (APT) family kinase protein